MACNLHIPHTMKGKNLPIEKLHIYAREDLDKNFLSKNWRHPKWKEIHKIRCLSTWKHLIINKGEFTHEIFFQSTQKSIQAINDALPVSGRRTTTKRLPRWSKRVPSRCSGCLKEQNYTKYEVRLLILSKYKMKSQEQS